MHLLNLILLMRDRFEIHLAVGEEGFLTHACRAEGVEVHHVRHLRRTQSVIGDFRALWQMYKLFSMVKPDLIHLHTFKAGFLGRVAAAMAGIPTVYTIHAWLWGTPAVSKAASMWAVPLERIGGGLCKRIITVSKAGERLVSENRIVAPEKVVTVYNGIADSNVRRTAPRSNRPVITMVARFTAGKDFESLVHAFAKVTHDSELWLVGDGETRPELESLVSRLRLSDRVTFCGERGDVPQLLANSDVFVLSSDSEMFPISIIEAMRAGIAVVASDVGGVRESVVEGVTGLLCPRSNVEALAAALNRVLEDDEFRHSLGRAGRKRYEALYGAERMAHETYLQYASILMSGGIRTSEPRVEPAIAQIPEQNS
jgi:glycosyltransferase involved in cell wall biosynthesis